MSVCVHAHGLSLGGLTGLCKEECAGTSPSSSGSSPVKSSTESGSDRKATEKAAKPSSVAY